MARSLYTLASEDVLFRFGALCILCLWQDLCLHYIQTSLPKVSLGFPILSNSLLWTQMVSAQNCLASEGQSFVDFVPYS